MNAAILPVVKHLHLTTYFQRCYSIAIPFLSHLSHTRIHGQQAWSILKRSNTVKDFKVMLPAEGRLSILLILFPIHIEN